MKCAYCNNVIPAGMNVCPSCGKHSPNVLINENQLQSKPQHQKMIIVGGVVVCCIFLGILFYFKQHPSSTTVANSSVAEVRSKIHFPVSIDAKTTWVDITANAGVIRYHYLVPNDYELDESRLRAILRANVCNSPSTLKMFRDGVSTEYFYSTKDLAHAVTLSFSSSDCVKSTTVR